MLCVSNIEKRVYNILFMTFCLPTNINLIQYAHLLKGMLERPTNNASAFLYMQVTWLYIYLLAIFIDI